MNKLKLIAKYIFSKYPIFGIIFIWGALLFTNHIPGTYMLGWDSLQTELDPALAVKRAFYSGWQEYQSLGLPAGMGHAADLLRAVTLYLASFMIPQNLIRYGFHMSMILIGAFGMLKLLYFSGLDKDKKSFAFLGALFYILNYNIIQMMFLPYESFTIFAGMLPWQIWAFLRILRTDKSKRKDWLIFILVFVLATPQSQALQLFVVLMLTLGLITLGLAKNKPFLVFKKGALAAILILLINSFWLLPQFHFLKTASSVVQTAKINQLSTQDVFYRNKDKGNLRDFITYTGFFNDGVDKNQQPLFTKWITHRENSAVTVIMFALTGVALLGIFTRSKYRLPFVLLYILVLVSLLNNTFPLNIINALIRENSFINQIFRSPFTKFSILYAVVASYFFAHGAYFIAKILSKFLSEKKYLNSINTFSVAIFTGLIISQALPAFSGNYISPGVKVAIPESYSELFKYFKTVDKNKRIALLPEYTHWGWFFSKWGYDGSGFIWYGIEQPIISRNFDMWSTKSEGYFWEMKNALEKEDIAAVENILDKYGVDYLVFDYSIAPVVSSTKAIQYSRVEDLLAKSSRIKIERKWDIITVYKIEHDKKIQDFVWTTDQLPNIGPEIDLTNQDTAYSQYGNYQTATKNNFNIYYPFLDLTTQTKLKNSNWEMTETATEFEFKAKLPGKVDVAEITGTSQTVMYHNNTAKSFDVPYKITAENGLIYVRFPKIVANTFQLGNGSLRYCVNKSGNIPSTQAEKSLRIQANSGDYVCADYVDLNLDQKYGYIVKIQNKNIEGQRLFFYILDKTKDQPYSEDRLEKDTEYYIVGSKFEQGVGYSFAFQANSYKTIPSVNEVHELSVYLMPYDVLKGLAVKLSAGDIKKGQASDSLEAKKLAYHKYIVDVSGNSKKTVVLNQAFQEGWKAYEMENGKWKMENWIKRAFPFVFGKEIRNHVIVNNWANGWVLDDSQISSPNSQVLIVYMPQYLQYIGYFLLVITPLLVIKLNKKNNI